MGMPVLQRPGKALTITYIEQQIGQDNLLNRCLPQVTNPNGRCCAVLAADVET